jgi:transcriptional regulator GlxA family with amidase domain
MADATGFGNRERMRRAFVRVFGRPPQELRRDGRDNGVGAHVVALEARRDRD